MRDPLEGVRPDGTIQTGAARSRVAAWATGRADANARLPGRSPCSSRILAIGDALDGVVAAVVDRFAHDIGLWDTAAQG